MPTHLTSHNNAEPYQQKVQHIRKESNPELFTAHYKASLYDKSHREYWNNMFTPVEHALVQVWFPCILGMC